MYDALLLPLPVPERRWVSWGAAASAGLHLALVVAAFWLTPLNALVAPAPQAVNVEIVTPEAFAALEAPAAVVAEAVPAEPEIAAPAQQDAGEQDAPQEEPARKEPAQAVTHQATTLYAADLLRQPAMGRIRRTLTQLADSERMVQLCNIEGLEQIKRAEPDYAPNALVAYALSEPVSRGLTLVAAGAAFRSRRNWFAVSLTCTVAPDYAGVTAFEFTVGDPVPEEKWDAAGLNAADADE